MSIYFAFWPEDDASPPHPHSGHATRDWVSRASVLPLVTAFRFRGVEGDATGTLVSAVVERKKLKHALEDCVATPRADDLTLITGLARHCAARPPRARSWRSRSRAGCAFLTGATAGRRLRTGARAVRLGELCSETQAGHCIACACCKVESPPHARWD